MSVTAPSTRELPPIDSRAGVSFVMPVLNEHDYLKRAVQTVMNQELDAPLELILALGPSTDGTTELAHAIAAADDRIRVVENPAADIPAGLNRAIEASSYPTIVRVDAHSDLQPEYTQKAIATLNRVGAANVGGIMRAEGKSTFQRAVARAYNSPFGLGGGAHHGSSVAGDADTAYLGVMRRSIIMRVGLFNESIRRGEDWELNLRLRKAGYRVWFDPELSVTYWPRDSWNRLARQFYATGRWRGDLVRRYGAVNSVRYFVPPVFLALVLVALIVAAAQLALPLSELAFALTSIAYVPVACYVLLILAVTAGPVGGRSAPDKLWTLAVLPTMHISWGFGFVVGLILGAKDTVDTSRMSGSQPSVK